MSVLDRIENFLGPESKESVVIDEQERMIDEILSEETLTESQVDWLLSEAGPKVETIGWKDNLFHVKIGGKPYSYAISTSKMVNKETGQSLTGAAAQAEFERRFRKMSSFTPGGALQKLLFPNNPTGNIPYAGGMKSTHPLDPKYFSGTTTQPAVGGTATPGHTQVPGAKVPVIKAPTAPALSQATHTNFSPTKLTAKQKAAELKKIVADFKLSDFAGSGAQNWHKLYDALDAIEKSKD